MPGLSDYALPLLALAIVVSAATLLLLAVRWGRRRAPRSFDELARRLGEEPRRLKNFRPVYRHVRIPKKSGGTRELTIPDARTKALRRKILRRVLGGLKSHPAASAYERGRSVVDNALPHVDSCLVIGLDLKSFFPNTRKLRIERFYRRLGWSPQAVRWLTRLTTDRDGLPQGAPTSPRLSNLVNRSLDDRITNAATMAGARYTRYADDMTLSWPRTQRDDPASQVQVRKLVATVSSILGRHGYRLNIGKSRFRREHRRQTVTGLIVNRSVGLPRETRRWLRAVEHRIARGRPATLDSHQLAGWRSYVSMIHAAGNKRSAGSVAEDIGPPEDRDPEPTSTLTPRAFADAIALIRDQPFDDENRRTLIQGLVDLTVDLQARLVENLPTLDDLVLEARGGRTLVLAESENGRSFEVRLPPDRPRRLDSLIFDQPVRVRGRIVDWHATFDRPVLVGHVTPVDELD